MGKLIVIDGLDGSGKGTQTRLLEKYLLDKNIKAKRIDFPRYGSIGCSLVESYLRGDLGKDPSATNAYAASLFFGMDRYYSFRAEWGEFYNMDDTVILCDRYTTANAVHQLSKLDKNEWDPYLEWLFDTEYNKIGLPKPDAVIYLEMPVEVSAKLIAARSEKEGRAKDIHELDTAYLHTCREAAMYAANKMGWTTVHCCENGNIRSIEDIFTQILQILQI